MLLEISSVENLDVSRLAVGQQEKTIAAKYNAVNWRHGIVRNINNQKRANSTTGNKFMNYRVSLYATAN